MLAWAKRHGAVIGFVILTLGIAAALAGVQHANNENRRLTKKVETNAKAAYLQACERSNQLRTSLAAIQDFRGQELDQILDQMVTNDHVILEHIRGNIAAFITPGSPDNAALEARLAEVDGLIAKQKRDAEALQRQINRKSVVARELTGQIECAYPPFVPARAKK